MNCRKRTVDVETRAVITLGQARAETAVAATDRKKKRSGSRVLSPRAQKVCRCRAIYVESELDQEIKMAPASVFLVEDAQFNVRLIQALLAREGLAVTVAESAEAALEILQESTPCLILMDVVLLGMNGLELTRLLKADPSKRGVPVIALTANDSAGERQAATEAGCDGFISKPIDPARFAARVRLFLDRNESTKSGNTAQIEFRTVRKDFLTQGLQESALLLQSLEQGGDSASIGRTIHRWIGCGETAGFPEITARARRLRDLMGTPTRELAVEVEEARALSRLFVRALASALMSNGE